MRGLELEVKNRRLDSFEIVSIYFGGGTPALLGATYIAEILSWLPNLSPHIEITLEANPDVIDTELIKSYAEVGINRLSIGVQTFNEALLKVLGRTHNAHQASQAVIAAANSGITNISIDLMYDLPKQSLVDWQDTLDKACSLPITHLSLYNLTIEPHTLFFKKQALLRPNLPSEEESTRMYLSALETLNRVGLEQYEISAFARQGLYSRHNVGYWTGRPFLGFGPSAFSYMEGKRFRNIANLSKYLKSLEKGLFPIDYEEKLEPEAALRETLTIALRLNCGLNLSLFPPLPANTLISINYLKQEGFLAQIGDTLKLTEKGILFYDTVAIELI